MFRGKRWLLPILYTHFKHVFIINVKQPTSTYKNFYLAVNKLGDTVLQRRHANFSGYPLSIASYGPQFSNYIIKYILKDAESGEEHDAS